MAIEIASPGYEPRGTVGFVGQTLSRWHRYLFEVRNVLCQTLTLDQLSDSATLAQLDAVIWTQDPERPRGLPRSLGAVIPTLLNHDVRVYIRLASDAQQTEVPRRLVVNALQQDNIPVANLFRAEWQGVPEHMRERELNFLAPSVYLVDTAMRWPKIAALVCDRPAGPRPKLDLQFDERCLHERFGLEHHVEQLLLLQRAFWNCDDLRLSFLSGGLSGAPVCKAYATLSAGQVQRGTTGAAYPHLYFVKIGRRKKIIDEYDKYCSQVLEYVPFHLTPRLRRDRCNLGATHGILVGDFVEGTETLLDCATGGRCGHAIANLFDKTLAGWRKQALEDQSHRLSSYFADKWLVEGTNNTITLPSSRAKIVKALGGQTNIPPLKQIFEKYGDTKPLYAPAHGDLHATNVLVRHGDAIIIDFEKLQADYPLTYDPASLEGGLLVEGFTRDLRKKTIEPDALVKLLDPLYELDGLLRRTQTLCPRGGSAEWYYDCVNQIRTLSWSSENENERGQYALTLALCLIRKGCNKNDTFNKEQNTLRAISFFFGQKVLHAFGSVKPYTKS